VDALQQALSQGWDDLLSRWGGPMSFRILLQPGLAMLFALRAGLRDAREGGPPFLIALIGSRKHRPALMRQLWQDVKSVFLLAVVFDVIYQSMNDRFNVLEMLITATVLAVIPYMLARGPVMWMAKWSGYGKRRSDVPASPGRND
jgi:hypothetical protein